MNEFKFVAGMKVKLNAVGRKALYKLYGSWATQYYNDEYTITSVERYGKGALIRYWVAGTHNTLFTNFPQSQLQEVQP